MQEFDWIFYIFGGFLIFSAIKLLLSSHTQEEVTKESPVLNWIKTKMKVTKEFYGQKFIVNVDGKTMFTPLALVLVLIEQTDLIFCFGFHSSYFSYYSGSIYSVFFQHIRDTWS